MEKQEKTKADQYDHNNHLPKDILNKEQDPNSFRDPLEQQLEKRTTSNETVKDSDRNNTSEE
jgi:hypothetical protein